MKLATTLLLFLILTATAQDAPVTSNQTEPQKTTPKVVSTDSKEVKPLCPNGVNDRSSFTVKGITKISGKTKIVDDTPLNLIKKDWCVPLGRAIPKTGEAAFGFKQIEGEKVFDPQTGVKIYKRGKVFSAGAGLVVYLLDSCKKDDKFCGNMLGNQIIISHGENIFTRYAHLKQGGLMVKVGETVELGQKIAIAGCTGTCEKTHLFFEIGSNLLKVKDINPCSSPVRFKEAYNPSSLIYKPRPKAPFVPIWCKINPGKGEDSNLRKKPRVGYGTFHSKIKKGHNILVTDEIDDWYQITFIRDGKEFGLDKPIYSHKTQVKCE